MGLSSPALLADAHAAATACRLNVALGFAALGQFDDALGEIADTDEIRAVCGLIPGQHQPRADRGAPYVCRGNAGTAPAGVSRAGRGLSSRCETSYARHALTFDRSA